MYYRSILFLVFFCHTASINAQYHEEKCIYGNCKNGTGIKRIKGNKFNPQPFDNSFIPLNTNYYYYEMGEFSKGSLNGKGYRVATWGHGSKGTEDGLIAMIKNNDVQKPDSKYYDWFESGVYADGFLDGKGVMIEFDALNKRPLRIREGEFKKGILHGKAIKIIPTRDGFINIHKDSSSGKYKIAFGRIFIGDFVNDICTNCSMTEYKATAGEGTINGEKIDEHFINGWVIKDYEEDNYSGKLKPVKPYKALFIGGQEVKKLATTEISATIKTVDLGNQNSYTGEVDDKGRPYGFGKMTLYGNPNWIYEGFVDDGKQEGWGYIELKNNIFQEILGGNFKNNRIMNGVVYKPTEGPAVLSFGNLNGDPNYDYGYKNISDGYYRKRTYAFEKKLKSYVLARDENGDRINGFEKYIYVNMGHTAEEKRKTRTVTNGFISISDLLVGDIVVLNGMASPIEKEIAGTYYLKNGKYVSSLTSSKIQLSKHIVNEFSALCSKCNGTTQMTYTYQRPPEQVELTSYRSETVVGDFTIWTRRVPQTTTYNKIYPPEKRSKTCDACNGQGKTKDLKEIPE